MRGFRASDYWTPYEDRRLREVVEGGGSIHALAVELDRSAEGLRRRARRLLGRGVRPHRAERTERAPMATEWLALHARLSWAHSPEIADAIFAGNREPTNADLLAWRNLGRGA